MEISTDATIGDFETFTGTVIQICQACPTGFECFCNIDSGINLTQDTTYATSGSSSVAMDPQVARQNSFGIDILLEQNQTYMASFWARSTDGTEDFKLAICDEPKLSPLNCYNWASRTYLGAFNSSNTFSNVPTTWTQYFAFFNGDSAGDITRSFMFTGDGTTGTMLYFDRLEIYKVNVKDAKPVGSAGNTYTPYYNASFVNENFGTKKDCLIKDSAGPARISCYNAPHDSISGMKTDVSVEATYDSRDHEEYGRFTAACRYIVEDATGVNGIMNKHPNGWYCGGDVSPGCYHYNQDGTFASTSSTNATSTLNAINSICYSVNNLHMETNNTSTITMYTGTKSATDTTAACPTKDNASYWTVGSFSSGTQQPINGSILECAYWQGAMSEAQCMKWNHPYSPGVEYGEGLWLDTCTQTTSHAQCNYDRCVNGQVNNCNPDFTGSLPVFDQETELVDNNSFETYTVSEQNPTFTSWTNGESNSTLKVYPYDSFHGEKSIRATSTSTTSQAFIQKCFVVSPNTDYYASIYAKQLGGTITQFQVTSLKYTSADCTTGYSAPLTFKSPTSITEQWEEYGGVGNTGAGTNSIKLVVYGIVNTVGDVLMDSITLKATSLRKPWAHCESGSGTCTYTSRVPKYHNPLSDAWDQEYGWENGYCMGGWFYTDWDGDDLVGTNSYLLQSQPTAGSNNKIALYVNYSTDEIQLNNTNDSGSNGLIRLALTSANWTGGDWKYVEFCGDLVDTTGSLRGHHYNAANSTWYDWSTLTGSDRAMDSVFSTIELGVEASGTADEFFEGYIHKFYMTEYSATYPQLYFNDGKAPPDPY